MRSDSSVDEVRMTTGTRLRTGSARRRCSTSKPLTFGSLRSSSTSAGSSSFSSNRRSSACWPSIATFTGLATFCFLSAWTVYFTSSGLSSTSRMCLFSIVVSLWNGSGGGGQREKERGALLHRPLGPGAAAVALDRAPHDGEADARSREFGFAVQAPERREQVFRIGALESGAVVAHEIRGLAALVHDADFDARAGVARSELPCVGEQVAQDQREQRAVAPGVEPGRNDERNVAPGRGRLQLGGDGAR